MMSVKTTSTVYTPLTERENWLGAQMVDIAVCIHKALGPGLLESIYEKCFCYELTKRNISFQSQKSIQLRYDQMVLEAGLRVDLLVGDLVIVELKSQEYYHSVWEAQLLSYLRLSGKRLGYVLNFNVPLMRDGIKRIVI